MPVSGRGMRKILIVAEAYGQKEDETGKPNVGEAGQHLKKALAKAGVDLERDCWKTNAVICRPVNNAVPTDEQINCCRPNLLGAIQELNPNVVIVLGASAAHSLIGYAWLGNNNDIGPINRWVSWKIPCQNPNVWICPTYHPQYLLRVEDDMLQLWFEKDIKKAVAISKKPWKEIPNYEIQVDRIYDPIKAANILRKMIEKGGTVAFDYETNMLKPDSNDSQIISCAVCWQGIKTIAYPWVGEAITATKELLFSDLGKIAGNMKFEERWSIHEFGRGVKNWLWDTVVGAHVLDNRSGITSVKFQSFVMLGQRLYDQSIKPYLQSDGSNTKNKIKEVSIETLLLYNGMDSILEYDIAMKQMQQLDYEC
jgi:uracil-DNA glycosylase family 4